jgi:hypothetical protein
MLCSRVSKQFVLCVLLNCSLIRGITLVGIKKTGVDSISVATFYFIGSHELRSVLSGLSKWLYNLNFTSLVRSEGFLSGFYFEDLLKFAFGDEVAIFMKSRETIQ